MVVFVEGLELLPIRNVERLTVRVIDRTALMIVGLISKMSAFGPVLVAKLDALVSSIGLVFEISTEGQNTLVADIVVVKWEEYLA